MPRALAARGTPIARRLPVTRGTPTTGGASIARGAFIAPRPFIPGARPSPWGPSPVLRGAAIVRGAATVRGRHSPLSRQYRPEFLHSAGDRSPPGSVFGAGSVLVARGVCGGPVAGGGVLAEEGIKVGADAELVGLPGTPAAFRSLARAYLLVCSKRRIGGNPNPQIAAVPASSRHNSTRASRWACSRRFFAPAGSAFRTARAIIARICPGIFPATPLANTNARPQR